MTYLSRSASHFVFFEFLLVNRIEIMTSENQGVYPAFW
jgi:hypothetical protein